MCIWQYVHKEYKLCRVHYLHEQTPQAKVWRRIERANKDLMDCIIKFRL
jgi:hypothetical protein